MRGHTRRNTNEWIEIKDSSLKKKKRNQDWRCGYGAQQCFTDIMKKTVINEQPYVVHATLHMKKWNPFLLPLKQGQFGT